MNRESNTQMDSSLCLPIRARIFAPHMDIATRLDAAMKAAGFESQSALARASGVPQPTINRILKGVGKKGPEASTLVKLAQACNVSFEWLHEGIGTAPPPAAHASVYGLREVTNVYGVSSRARTKIKKVSEFRLSAGITGFSLELDARDGGTWEVPTRWMEKHNFSAERLIAIDVKGESMEPSLYDGDLVIINTADALPVNGQVYAVNYEGEAVIKRMVREGGQWWLSSDNPSPRFPRRICRGEECIVVGRVVRRETDQI